ncbi:MAG: triose-phosphate isomerase [Halieaceae bacterium]|jgi:triosephosphate isomerase|nr:triose-phosphate isomerase [Halieaceae bacterium]
MRRKLVAGNWKMHGSTASIEALVTGIVTAGCGGNSVGQLCDVVVAPPFPYLAQVKALLGESHIALAAQTCSAHEQGAHTGDVCADMLVDVGCQWVILGHSERREAGETDAQVAAQAAAARAQGLVPILCVGETLAERKAGRAESVVAAQLDALLPALTERDVIAYEPVWAIGTGETATPEQAQAMHAAIRAQLQQQRPALASGTRLLYGGSVKPDNAATLFAQPDIDGGLIGGASLIAEDFNAIVMAAQD